MNWKGVMPAITTCFREDFSVDHGFMATHCGWLLDNGCTGIVALGSLGEGATLSLDEKRQILRNCIDAVHGRGSVVASISALTTSEAVALAKAATDLGCDGLMVLPPFVYQGDWREMKTHVAAVFQATPLSCMLYNNPVAYGTDFFPNRFTNWRPNTRTSKQSRNRAPMPGEYLPSARCWTDGCKYPSAWMMRYWKPLESERWDGLPVWPMPCPVNRWSCSTAESMARVIRHSSCIAGSCPCSVWIQFPTSFNSSNWYKPRWAWGIPVCARHGWSWWGENWSRSGKSSATLCAPGRSRRAPTRRRIGSDYVGIHGKTLRPVVDRVP